MKLASGSLHFAVLYLLPFFIPKNERLTRCLSTPISDSRFLLPVLLRAVESDVLIYAV